MTKNNQSDTDNTIQYNRRASDRGDSVGGIQSGGRRKSDRPHALPRSNAAKIAIACSFIFSAALIAWAFTLPFRSTAHLDTESLKDLPEAELAKLEYEARLSPQAYVEYTRQIDRRLLDRLHDKNLPDRNLPTAWDAREKWVKGVENQKQHLEKMKEEAGEKGFDKNSIEWQHQQELEKILEDTPPGV
ncbi:MAG: hypothetical protein KDB00_26920 [Planctomycetales bacterium]|nr:hypothetical protein [Planctomycetales bacterium]